MNKIIYDIGVNNGQSSRHYLDMGHKVIGIEANPVLCNKLKKLFSKEISENKYVLIEGAISNISEDTIDLYINMDDDEWTSIFENTAARIGLVGEGTQYYKTSVKNLNLLDIFKKYGSPNYIKIDIEDADTFVLDILYTSKLKNKPDYISIELILINDIKKLLDLGYDKFKLVPQSQNKIDGHWSAGKIGEEAINFDNELEWMNTEELYKSISHCMRLDSKSGRCLSKTSGEWYDIHAKLK